MGSSSEKKTSREVIERIIGSLNTGRKSIFEVSKDAGITWESSRNYLEMLRDTGMAEESMDGNKRVFALKVCTQLFAKRPDTLFGIPITSEQENRINFLFMRIREEWKSKTGNYPGKTQLHKILVDVVNECGLDVPVGWYRFGQLCIRNYDPQADYPFTKIPDGKKVMECISKAVQENKAHNAAYLKKRQYIKSGNILYLKHMEFESNFEVARLSEENRSELGRILMDMGFSFKITEHNTRACAILNDFLSAMLFILRNMSEEDINNRRAAIANARSSVWEMVATHNLFESLLGKYGYDKSSLLLYFEAPFKIMESIADDSVSRLREMCRMDEFQVEDFRGFEDIRRLIGSVKAKKLTKGERRKSAEEFAKDSSDVFRKLNLK